MSGGSFDYFYNRAPDTVRRIGDELLDMATRCRDRASEPTEPSYFDGNGERITTIRPTETVDLEELRKAADYLESLSDRAVKLAAEIQSAEALTHNVEWWCSSDVAVDAVVAAWRKVKATRG